MYLFHLSLKTCEYDLELTQSQSKHYSIVILNMFAYIVTCTIFEMSKSKLLLRAGKYEFLICKLIEV